MKSDEDIPKNEGFSLELLASVCKYDRQTIRFAEPGRQEAAIFGDSNLKLHEHWQLPKSDEY